MTICSGRDQWLLNEADIDRFSRTLPNCIVRKLKDNGHFLFFVSDLSLHSIHKEDGPLSQKIDTNYNYILC